MDTNNKIYVKTQVEKSLALNIQMQSQLITMRGKLERLLANVKDTYEANNVLLTEGVLKPRRNGVGMKGAYLKGGTFYLKGNMFFKDISCRNCPNNEDYEKRKMQNEMFPMDIYVKARHVWSTKDKQGIILGIKEQIIDFLEQSSKGHGRKSKQVDSEKLAKLLNIVPDDFRIDWEYISSCNLGYRHTAKNCEAIWNLFLHPSLNRSAWSEKENLILLEAAKKYNFQNWQAIADEVGQRSDFQCFVQYKSNVCHMLPESYTKWSKEDDKRLLEVISRNTVNGNINWSNVNAYFPHKAKTTLHSRYYCTLNPHINRGTPFTPEEDLLLIAAVKEYGNKFSCIPRTLFPNRSLVQLRSHYNNVLAKRHSSQSWSIGDDIKLMDFVTENGTKSWLECERAFGGRHSRLSCRTRYLTIKRYLAKNPDGKVEDLPRKKGVSKQTSVNMNNWKEKVQELSDIAQKPKQTAMVTEKVKKIKSNRPKRIKKSKLANTEVEEVNKPVKNQPVRNLKKRSNKSKIVEKKTKPYMQRLRLTDKKNYNYFKYAYNFDISHHPCANIRINSEDFAVVFTALNPQLLSYNFDLNMPKSVTDNNIIKGPQLLSKEPLALLPPSLSTAMGFRALCINTADVINNLPCNNFSDIINSEYITKFRERLRFIFYATALLSRLDPSMMGIQTVPIEPPSSKLLKPKRCVRLKEKKNKNKNTSPILLENVELPS